MLNRFLFSILLIWLHVSSFSQTCTPLVSTGFPGVSPPTENLQCINRGVQYSDVIYIENFNTFSTTLGTAQVNYLKIDSFNNLPCGMQWAINPTDSMGPSETSCISLYGTTTDSVGQYRVKIYVTISVDVPQLGTLILSGEADSLNQQVVAITGMPTGVNYKYYLRVIEAGGACPVLDTLNSAPNVIACTPFSISLIASDTICSGASTMLNAVATGGTTPYKYIWSPSGVISDTTIANPTANANSDFTAVLTVIDASGDTLSESKQVVVEVCSGLKDKHLNDFVVAPNPSNGKFRISMNYANYNIQILSTDGKIISEGNSLNNNALIDLSDEPKGIYIMKLTSEKGVGIKRIILE